MTETATMKTTTLTEKEHTLLTKINLGMDIPGEGWLHEIAEESRQTAGVLGSLVKKGFAKSGACQEPQMPTCYWVSITPEGEEALGD